jgi:O-methyltransferase
MKEIYRIKDELFFHATWQDRSSRQKFKHSLIFPKNTYRPWLGDQEFLSVYEAIKEHTLVDQYRCFELWDLAQQMSGLEGAVVEVGVWRGGTAAILAKASGAESRVFLCDTFEGVVKASADQDSVYKGGEHADTSISLVESLLVSLGLSNCFILKGIFSEETAHLLTESSVKICHIDVDVYQSAKDIFTWVWPRLIPGGVVIFDDFGFGACEGITQLVNEITSENPQIRRIYNINGHGILFKIGAG